MTEVPSPENILILVTGAGGWLGSHCTYQLLEYGYKVRGTVRDVNGAKYQFLKTFHPKAAENLQLVACDLTAEKGWDEAVAGVNYILHVASPFSFTFKDENEIIKPAVKGVEFVFHAAFKNPKSIQRIVQTSSVCAVVYGHSKERYCALNPNSEGPQSFKEFDESEWSDAKHLTGYEKSKTLAEKRAWELIEEHNAQATEDSLKIGLTTMCPGFIFGPIFHKSHAAGESSQQISRVLLKTFPFVPPMSSSHVDVRDVALAHIKAIQLPADQVDNQRFLLCAEDGNLSFQEQSKMLSDLFKPYGFNPALTVAPKALITIGKLFFSSVRVCADKVGCRCDVSNAKATEVLGIKWRPMTESFWGHGLTLMKYGALEKRKIPDDVVDGYEAY